MKLLPNEAISSSRRQSIQRLVPRLFYRVPHRVIARECKIGDEDIARQRREEIVRIATDRGRPSRNVEQVLEGVRMRERSGNEFDLLRKRAGHGE